MRIGIITCHDVFNAGSSLQAYALRHFLGQNGENVKIIDYKTDYMYRLIDFMRVDSPKWQKTCIHRWAYRARIFPYNCSLLPKYYCYKRFNKEYLALTKPRCTSFEDLQKIGEYDVLICGSDQIWATENNKCGEDPAFYLAFSETAKKIAYAASFGADCVNEAGVNQIKKNLPKFSAISVREKSGVDILRRNGISGVQVMDPVFLVEKEHWEKMRKPPAQVPERFAFVYGYDNDNDVDIEGIAEVYAKQRGLRVVTLKGNGKYALGGPEQFLWLISHAEIIFTSSFHALAFSVIFERPFVAFQTGNRPLFERLNSLLNLTGLQDRIWVNGRTMEDYGSISYEAVRKPVQDHIRASKQFLLEAIYGPKT